MSQTVFAEARSWKEEEGSSEYLHGAADRVVSSEYYFSDVSKLIPSSERRSSRL